MPDYTQLSTQTANTMLRNLESLAREIADGKGKDKSKKLDKKQLAALENTLAGKVQVFVKRVTDDIRIAKAGYNRLSLEIEGWLGDAARRVKAAESGLASYKRTRNEADIGGVKGLGKAVHDMAEAADAGMTAFAASWNEYRQFNADDFAKHLKEFASIRQELMNATIVLRNKEKKLRALAELAGTIETGADTASTDFEISAENKVRQAREYLERIRKVPPEVNKGRKAGPEIVVDTFPRWQEFSRMSVEELKEQYELRVSTFKGLAQNAQTGVAALAALRKAQAAGKAMFSAEDRKDSDIDSALREADQIINAFEVQVREAQRIVTKEIPAMLKQAQERIRKGK